MSDLENVLRVVLIKEGQIYLCTIFTLKDKLIPQDFCALENRLSEHKVEDTLPLFIGDRRIQLWRIEGFKLNFEVLHQRVIIRNCDCGIFLLGQLLNKLLFKSRFALVCHIFISNT